MINKLFRTKTVCIALMMALLLSCVPAIGIAANDNLTELKPNDKGKQVEQYQDRLTHYGYLDEPNSVFDGETKLATKLFQAANKVSVTGTATTTTRKIANKSTGVTSYDIYEAKQSAAGFKAKNGTFSLSIMQVQERLKELGYYTGSVNGTFSTAFGKAIVKFKKYNNFKNASASVTASERLRIDADTAMKASEVNGADTIKPGSKDKKAVLKAQVVLRDLKFYTGTLNGKYASAMVTSVKKFQKANGIYPTGTLYSTSMAIINKHLNTNSELDLRAYEVIAVAESKLGKKYASRKAGPNQFDCSGFTYYVFKKANVGVTLADSSSAQSKKGKLIVNEEDLLPGDLVFFATGSNTGKLNHVGVVYDTEGNNVKFMHSSSSAKKVIKSAFRESDNGNFYAKRFLFGRRMW